MDSEIISIITGSNYTLSHNSKLITWTLRYNIDCISLLNYTLLSLGGACLFVKIFFLLYPIFIGSLHMPREWYKQVLHRKYRNLPRSLLLTRRCIFIRKLQFGTCHPIITSAAVLLSFLFTPTLFAMFVRCHHVSFRILVHCQQINIHLMWKIKNCIYTTSNPIYWFAL